jgi:hypothetical protein
MKTISLLTTLALALAVTGCFHHSSNQAPPPPSTTIAKPIVTPDTSFSAKVISVNNVGRFVVLSFPPDQMPKVNQPLFLYRAGLKVADVKVTGPQQENNIVADLLSGDAQIGDTVRDQ